MSPPFDVDGAAGDGLGAWPLLDRVLVELVDGAAGVGFGAFFCGAVVFVAGGVFFAFFSLLGAAVGSSTFSCGPSSLG